VLVTSNECSFLAGFPFAPKRFDADPHGLAFTTAATYAAVPEWGGVSVSCWSGGDQNARRNFGKIVDAEIDRLKAPLHGRVKNRRVVRLGKVVAKEVVIVFGSEPGGIRLRSADLDGTLYVWSVLASGDALLDSFGGVLDVVAFGPAYDRADVERKFSKLRDATIGWTPAFTSADPPGTHATGVAWRDPGVVPKTEPVTTSPRRLESSDSRSSNNVDVRPSPAAVDVPSVPESNGSCAENGSCYGDPSALTGAPKTVPVRGYYRKDGTYVRGHYRSR
jgi:hypothetical protein